MRACWPVLGLILLLVAPAAGDQETRYADCTDDLAGANDRGPAAGTVAPEFSARLMEERGSRPATLESLLAAGRPVILAFGSYT